MKIEKINENQIKCKVSNEELMERQLEAKELAYGGDKARVFLEELMLKASKEYNFKVERGNPLKIEARTSNNGVELIVTKDTSFMTSTRSHTLSNDYRIFSFVSFEDLIKLSKTFKGVNFGNTTLYKNEKDNIYYLATHKGEMNTEDYVKINEIISEYSIRLLSDGPTLAYLNEYCDEILNGDVLETLAQL